MDFDENGIAGVETPTERIETRIFVNAAGAWASSIAKMAEIELPVEPLRRMLVPTEPFDKISHNAPLTIDMSTGFHFRPEGLGFLMAWNDPQETPGYKTEFERSFVEKILSRAVSFAPVFEDVEVNPSRAWAGLYEMTAGSSSGAWADSPKCLASTLRMGSADTASCIRLQRGRFWPT